MLAILGILFKFTHCDIQPIARTLALCKTEILYPVKDKFLCSLSLQPWAISILLPVSTTLMILVNL